MSTAGERRRAPRYSVVLPVRTPDSGVGRVFGVTRDVSSGGLYFYTEMPEWKSGARIEFVFQFPAEITGETATVLCRGTVVRAETAESVRGLAVRIERISLLDT